MPRGVPNPKPEYDQAAVEARINNKVLAKTMQMVVGVDLIGSKMSMAHSRTLELEVTPLGIKALSKNSGRTILIPWTNIKGVELFS